MQLYMASLWALIKLMIKSHRPAPTHEQVPFITLKQQELTWKTQTFRFAHE